MVLQRHPPGRKWRPDSVQRVDWRDSVFETMAETGQVEGSAAMSWHGDASSGGVWYQL